MLFLCTKITVGAGFICYMFFAQILGERIQFYSSLIAGWPNHLVTDFHFADYLSGRSLWPESQRDGDGQAFEP